MMLVKQKTISIFFGTAQNSVTPARYSHLLNTSLVHVAPFVSIASTLYIQSLYFLHQVHGVKGVIIKEANQLLRPFSQNGDFLITNIRHVGLGVVTADCLPIVVHDQINQAVGIAHAGWRGSVQQISSVMLNAMRDTYGTNIKDVQVFFGPSAKQCCYVVAKDFIHNFRSFPYAESLFAQRNNELYFDLPGFNYKQLTQLGIDATAINTDYNVCTMCSVGYCSYRLQKENAGRQMTVVSLN